MTNDLLMDAILAVLAFGVLTGALFFLKRLKAIARFRGSLNVLFLVSSVSFFMRPHIGQGYVRVIYAALFSTFAYIAVRLLDLLMFDVFIRHRRGGLPVPVVLRATFRWSLLSLALYLIIKHMYPDVDLKFLAFSTIVVGYILGNASQDTLGNLIAGLALTGERPFSIGDWVRVGDFVGRVTDMTWRATRLQTKMLDYIIIPNATIAREYIVNYSRPTQSHGFTQEIGVNYGVPPNKVRGAILRACEAVPEILTNPAPLVWLHNYGDFSIDYTVKFFIREFSRLEQIQSDMMDRVWYEFKREDIVIPFPIRDVRPMNDVEAKAERERAESVAASKVLLGEIPIFSHLSKEERDQVAERMEEKIYGAGEALVRKGDAGNRFYIVLEGSTSVHLGADTRSPQVALLKRGDYFGEMSLLTGEERSATVVAVCDCHVLELSHLVLQELLREKKSLAEDFAKALKARAAEMATLQKSVDAENSKHTAEPSEKALLSKIWDFFGI
ncbi:MAG: mechanosensitive ion channel family protein [Kiritimatiellia bacterium]|jgi:small-conductance mechanosensitive channel/CRP-like cAMP-binding protein|nr:mechanosensitive ion channel family protein [Kiritimatiellia bacterium]MDP6809734.1 mechanosensitive ion channel family protein [Kiritimatiellia bacterium]MDP7025156.1 mechanosensitive ion channel family protein [Kiritimatiellia bacterium]